MRCNSSGRQRRQRERRIELIQVGNPTLKFVCRPYVVTELSALPRIALISVVVFTPILQLIVSRAAPPPSFPLHRAFSPFRRKLFLTSADNNNKAKHSPPKNCSLHPRFFVQIRVNLSKRNLSLEYEGQLTRPHNFIIIALNLINLFI